MPPQPTLLARTWPAVPAVPGAINLTSDQLTLLDILSIATAGATSAQTTLAQLQAFLLAPFRIPSRVVTSGATVTVADTDVGLLIDKASITTVDLGTPVLGRMIFIKDMGGNAETYNITLDAGSGKLINGQQTLVMNANFVTTMLIGMSDSQWGTLI